MRTFIGWFVVVLVGCSKGGEAPKPVVDKSAETVAKTVPNAANAANAAHAPNAPSAKVAKPSADIPAWTPLAAMNEGAPAKPVGWVAPRDGKATLAVFSASWCPGCTASALADRALVKSHGEQFQIGVALQSESDDAFVASKYAQALSGVPVWSEASVGAMTKACEPRAIPSACLYAKGKVLWTGDAAGAGAALEAHTAGTLDAWVAGEEAAEAQFKEHAKAALAESDPAKIAAAVAVTHGRAGWQNSVAWNLVDREQVSAGAAALAVALSRDAVASDGGVDFAHLDTYALALAKAGRVGDAAYVGARVIEVCSAVQGKCSQEKQRAEEFIARANAL